MKAMEGRLLYLNHSGLLGPPQFRPFQTICLGSPRQYLGSQRVCFEPESSVLDDNNSHISERGAAILLGLSLADLRWFSAEPVWGKFNPNQMAHSSFSRTTNSLNSPQSQPPLPTNRLFHAVSILTIRKSFQFTGMS